MPILKWIKTIMIDRNFKQNTFSLVWKTYWREYFFDKSDISSFKSLRPSSTSALELIEFRSDCGVGVPLTALEKSIVYCTTHGILKWEHWSMNPKTKKSKEFCLFKICPCLTEILIYCLFRNLCAIKVRWKKVFLDEKLIIIPFGRRYSRICLS